MLEGSAGQYVAEVERMWTKVIVGAGGCVIHRHHICGYTYVVIAAEYFFARNLISKVEATVLVSRRCRKDFTYRSSGRTSKGTLDIPTVKSAKSMRSPHPDWAGDGPKWSLSKDERN